jgi:hypothetical protein
MKSIKRAFEIGDTFGYEVKIYKGAFYGRMAKESFKGIDISSLVYQVSGEGVTKRMDAVAFGYAGFFFAM